MTKTNKASGGTLEDWSTDIGQSVIGRIFDDPQKRFIDGALIRTSFIVKLNEKDGTLETRNTLYKLGKKFEGPLQ